MTTTPVVFYGRNAEPPFGGPLTVNEMTPGDVNTASFYYANNPVSQTALGDLVERGYVEIGEDTATRIIISWTANFSEARLIAR
jgi:hypothetical protein